MSRKSAPTAGFKSSGVQNILEERRRGANGNSGSSDGGGNGRDASELPVVPGLAELVEVLNAMAAAPLGERPQLDRASIDRIKDSQLRPVLKGLEAIYIKFGPLEGSLVHLQAQTAQQPNGNLPTPLTASTPGSGLASAQQPTPAAAAPATAGITSAEAGLKSVSSKLKSVSEAITVSRLVIFKTLVKKQCV